MARAGTGSSIETAAMIVATTRRGTNDAAGADENNHAGVGACGDDDARSFIFLLCRRQE